MKNIEEIIQEQQRLQKKITNLLEQMNEKQEQKKQQQQQAQQKQPQSPGGQQPQSGKPGEGEPGPGDKKPGEGFNQGKNGGRNNRPHVIDNHEVWNSQVDPEQVKMAVDNALKKAMEETERTYGSDHIPKELRSLINETLKPPKVDWRNVLRNYIGRKISFDRANTRKRANRRLGLKALGKTNKPGPLTLFMVDCSGSVDDEQYLEILGEIKGALKNFPDKCEIGFFDTQIHEKTVKLSAAMPELPARPLQGGTCFQPVIDYADEKNPDLLIILTDGEAPPPTAPSCSVLWVILGNKDYPLLPGHRIVVDPKELHQVSEVLSN